MPATSMNAQACYRAIATRDRRFDGLFFTAVRTTGIYCRPVCPARTPLLSSCLFYETAAAAERDGFRPCLRCRPELAPGRPEWGASLAQAVLARIQAGALNGTNLEAFARSVGLSSRQLRRLLLAQFGITPSEAAQTQRLLFAKKLLHETALSMTEVALAAGFGSVRRFNATFKERYGMAPGAIRRGRGAPGDSIVLRLAYRPPLAWAALLEYLRARSTAGVEAIVADGYWRTVAIEHGAAVLIGWLAVTNVPEAAVCEVRIAATLAPALLEVTRRVRAVFDLDADPARIAEHLVSDPALAACIAAHPGLRLAGGWDAFELALRAVLGQQVSVAGATTLAGRLATAFGAQLLTPLPELGRLAPTPEALARVPLDALAAIGLPRQRAATISHLARFSLAGGFELPPGIVLDDAVARLVAVPGIGPWTAHYIAMRWLRQPDAFPADDLGLKRAIAALEPTETRSLPSARALERRAERWKPWRAYAAAYLWRSEVRAR